MMTIVKNLPQSLFKNLKILDLGNTLVVEIQNSSLFDEALCKLGFFGTSGSFHSRFKLTHSCQKSPIDTRTS
jgi:hypothetical protein